MMCKNCNLWRKGIPEHWDCAFIRLKGQSYGFCEAIDDVMFANENCIASKEAKEKAIPLGD